MRRETARQIQIVTRENHGALAAIARPCAQRFEAIDLMMQVEMRQAVHRAAAAARPGTASPPARRVDVRRPTATARRAQRTSARPSTSSAACAAARSASLSQPQPVRCGKRLSITMSSTVALNASCVLCGINARRLREFGGAPVAERACHRVRHRPAAGFDNPASAAMQRRLARTVRSRDAPHFAGREACA